MSKQLGADANYVVGVPIQPLAKLELPSYRENAPAQNLLPVVISACGVTRGANAMWLIDVSLYNQTDTPVSNAEVQVEIAQEHEFASVSDLRAYEYRVVRFSADEPFAKSLERAGTKTMTCRLLTT